MAQFDTNTESLRDLAAMRSKLEPMEAEMQALTRQLSVSAETLIAQSPTPEDRIAVASYVYWHMPEVTADSIAAGFRAFNENFHSSVISRIVGPCPFVFRCEKCGDNAIPSSRSNLMEWRRFLLCNRKRNRFNGPICLKCKQQETARDPLSEQKMQWERQQREARLRALRTMPYKEYLQTEHWLEFREARIRGVGYRCQLCNGGGILDVHHRTYERRGCEQWNDVTVLCRNCHGKFHNKLP